MKQKIVGTYYIGHEYCQLVIREGTGGEFWFTPEHGSIGRIKVGADYKEWSQVVSVLIHEAMEYSLTKLRRRYDSSGDLSGDDGDWLFVFSHSELSIAAANVALFMTPALPDLATVWRTWNKVEKPKRRK